MNLVKCIDILIFRWVIQFPPPLTTEKSHISLTMAEKVRNIQILLPVKINPQTKLIENIFWRQNILRRLQSLN